MRPGSSENLSLGLGSVGNSAGCWHWGTLSSLLYCPSLFFPYFLPCLLPSDVAAEASFLL